MSSRRSRSATGVSRSTLRKTAPPPPLPTYDTLRETGAVLGVSPAIPDLLARKRALMERKTALLREQRALVDEMHETLAHPTEGLLRHTTATLRNVAAAVSKARAPGFFAYYEAPEAVQAKEPLLRDRYAAGIKELQGAIAAVDAELAQWETEFKTAIEPKPAEAVTSLSGWLAAYGRPVRSQHIEGYATAFVQSGRVRAPIGNMFPAWQSQASTMVRGSAFKLI